MTRPTNRDEEERRRLMGREEGRIIAIESVENGMENVLRIPNRFLSVCSNPRLDLLLQIFKGIEMAESKTLRKPIFTKVDQLRPGTSGHTLTIKVVNTKMVLQKGRPDGPQVRQIRIAESLVGDETGMIIFTARNEQVDFMKEGATLTLRNAKIDMFKGSMRLAVDKWGRVEVAEPDSFKVKEDNNLSLIEYELINIVEE
ncbi:hypothetical protein V6Z11_D05G340800 [Gossypium hirsutum]|uniref:Uncharacterized protein At4g28440 n=6 Tax=Gossypium TaxID=3633 RepID=A0ABM3A122_GOSHI|nr:uncharacterized protein At4g28440 [Gossypium hirsutum]